MHFYRFKSTVHSHTIVDYRGGWRENVLRDALFSLLGTNQKCLTTYKWVQHWFPNGNEKKCLLSFETHVFHSRELSTTRRWAIDSEGLARLVEISSVVKIVLLAMSFSVFAFGLVGCNSRWDLSLFLIMILCYLAPATRYSSQFTFQVFFSKRLAASLFREIVIYSPVKLRFSIKLIATELFSAPFNSWMAISQHTKNPPKSVRWKIRKIGNKDF